MKPDFIIIHHSLTEDSQTVSWSAIRDYHMLICGWHDIGYHYGIEKIGTRYEVLKGRMDTESGAHCLGFNKKSIGICLIGNFDTTPPNEAQLKLLKKLVNSLQEIYGIPTLNVIGHWESYELRKVPVEKSCPGLKFSMSKFREIL